MKEIITLFIAEYLIFSIFLLPLLGLYLFINIKKVSLGLLNGFHKILLLGTIVLPVSMILFSYTVGTGNSMMKPDANNQVQIQVENLFAGSFDVAAGNNDFTEFTSDTMPIIQDVVYYFMDLFVLFSMSGLLIFIMRYAIQSVRIRKIKQNSLMEKIDTNYPMISSQMVTIPFSFGLFQKMIFLPSNMPQTEKDLVVRHEINHFRCNHQFWSFLELILTHVFWFNPIMHILRKRGPFIREMECDGLTTQKVNRYEYTRLLLKTAESISGINDSHLSFASHGWARKKELKMRIERLLAKGSRKRKILISVLLAVGIVFTVGMGLLFGNLNYAVKEELARIREVYKERIPVASRIDIEKVPGHFINALLVHEDSRFYKHNGLDKKSVFRAAGVNLKSFFSGGSLSVQGGSSITQQLAKQFLKNRERTLKRKLKELKIARVLEKNFNKDQILEMYLNMVYFGNGNLGLKSASEFYFKHDYTQLTLPESAMLVPFLDAPSKYNFLADPESAKKRQKRLLERIARI